MQQHRDIRSHRQFLDDNAERERDTDTDTDTDRESHINDEHR